MLIIGLTGSIGMGKSAIADMFASHGVPTYDADAAVHELYAGAAIEPVEEAFPGVAADGRIERAKLSAKVVGDKEAIARLEAIVHPLVRQSEHAFLDAAADSTTQVALIDIPLLLETGGEERVDAVIVVSAPADVQRERVLAREDMTEEKLAGILARQMPDAEKRRCAHFVVDTSRGFPQAQKQVEDILRALAAMPGRAYARIRAERNAGNRT